MVFSISFSGGSWIALCYYMGCVLYITEYIEKNNIPDDDIITLGASAGAWAAFFIQSRKYYDFETLKNRLFSILNCLGCIPILCEKHINKYFDDTFRIPQTLIKEITKNLYISVTKIKWFGIKNILINNFQNQEDLKKCLLRSSRLPGIIGFSVSYMDGSFTNNQPIYNNKTIKINAITKYLNDAHIYPSGWINPLGIIIPPSDKEKERLYNMGYKDTMSYFEKLNNI